MRDESKPFHPSSLRLFHSNAGRVLHPTVSEQNRSKYRLLGLVGRGQFGRVYCAVHRTTGKLVALKALDHDRFPTHKFLRELRFLLTLQHPNIVTCDALEHFQDGRYLVMEYCEGGTLRSLMDAHQCLHPWLGVKLVTDILAGVDHAHSRGIVHCDIKPENILLNLSPTGWTAKLSDFGIARLRQDLTLEAANITGSPAYMAPERFYGQYSESTDLYAIGILLFELLVGHRPFSGLPLELMSAHLNQPVEIPTTVPLPLRQVVNTALQKLKARRFSSAAQMLTEIQAAMRRCAPLWETSPMSPMVLLQPIAVKPQPAFTVVREERMDQPIHQIAVLERSPLALYDRYLKPSALALLAQQAESDPSPLTGQLRWRDYPKGLLFNSRQRGEEVRTMALSEPIERLVLQGNQCFAMTPRSLYILTGKEIHLLKRFETPTQMAIDPHGNWMVATSRSGQSLEIWQLSGTQPLAALPMRTIDRRIPPEMLGQIVALDSRHLATVLRSAHASPLLPSGVAMTVDISNRRGQFMGTLNLPVLCDRILPLTLPYRFAAIEPQYPQSILLLRVKPLKLARIALDIQPKFLVAIPKGLIVVSEEGQLVVLDHDGDRLAKGDLSAAPCAIASAGENGLLVATWENGQGKLYTLDLSCLSNS